MKKENVNFAIAAILVLLAAFSRVIMYPHNFSPIIGMALFAGATFKDRKYAYIFPIAAMLISDVMFELSGKAPGFWGLGQVVNYGILALITAFAFNLKKITPISVFGFSISASLIFFFLSNMSVFFIDNRTYHMYSQDMKGFVECYIAALPFLKISLIADLVYSTLLFGSYYLVTHTSYVKKLA